MNSKLINKISFMLLVEKRCCVICIISISVILLSCTTFSVNADSKMKFQEKMISNFLDKLEKGDISKVEMYHVNWESTYFSPLSEEDLLNSSEIKIVFFVRGHFCPYRLKDFKTALSTFRFYRASEKPVDFRLVVVFYEKDKEILRLLFTQQPIVTINGQSYYSSSDLFMSLVKQLPKEDYQAIVERFSQSWASEYNNASLKELSPKAYEEFYGDRLKGKQPTQSK